MADPEASSKSWWATLPGVLTALAGIITAFAGLFAVLGQQGMLGSKGAPAAGAAAPMAATAEKGAGLAATGGAARTTETRAAVSSPALVVEGLRAQGFKGLAVTAVDGSVISLPPTAEIYGQAFPLSSEQKVQFDRLVSVEIAQPWDGRVMLTLTNGQQLAATAGSYTLSGTNELGRYPATLPDIRRIDFIR